ncbi:MAG: O-antigen ligase family protein [Lentisphaeria bacterium]|nr:O-antigen ligase family protein [Lentisphaeria bacterium]
MKYLFFFSALFFVLPVTVALLCERLWIRWIMLGLLLPLLVFNQTSINFFSNEFYRGTSRGMEVSFVYIIAFIVLLSLSILRGVRSFLPDWGSRLYLVYFLCCLPSLRNADNFLFSFFELWKMFMIHLVFLAVYHYLEFSSGDFDILLYGLTGVIAVNFCAVVVQHFWGIYQVYGVFPHQNSMAMFMLLSGVLLFSRYFNLSEGRKSRFFFIALGLASVALVRTYSRGALVCYPFGGLVALLYSVWYKFSFRKVCILFGIAVICVIALAVFLPRIIERFEKAPESSGETRKNLAIAAVNMMKDVPVCGVGINNWGIKINPPYNYSRHREDKHYKDSYKDGIVETIYLLVGAECGVPCLVALLSWFGFYWFSCVRLMKILRGTRFFYIPAGALGGLTGIFLQSALEWVLKQQMNFMLLVIIFAFISYLNKHCRELAVQSETAGAVTMEKA